MPRCQHCGGSLVTLPVDDRRLREPTETSCLLCGRSPSYVETGPPPVRQMPVACLNGHPSERYGYWSPNSATRYRCSKCESDRGKQRRAAARVGHEAGQRAGWKLEGTGGLKRRFE